ncbi:YciI family protein [Dinoroseobacter sp. PD6]|uniref:YciI family protein n=1 Tax=Dinoroseobacter sp. PD6 TaxID=3028384 RepID=UPI00237AB093|nr:YciI family protein [Dinoroseobacter sp. PD6]MDD9715783.1 YciI family protein [Dinoroseobacter sp. PD6]
MPNKKPHGYLSRLLDSSFDDKRALGKIKSIFCRAGEISQMRAWADYKSEAKSRGALAEELYAVLSSPAGASADVRVNLPAHLAYQEASGALFLAGPVSDESGEMMEGMGLINYRVVSLDAAPAIAEADPMHRSGARSFVLRRWLVNEGALTLREPGSARRALPLTLGWYWAGERGFRTPWPCAAPCR